MKKTALILIFLSGTYLQLSAQDFITGLEYGIGNSTYQRMSDEHISEEFRTQRGGLMLEFSPYFSSLFITSGVQLKTSEPGKELFIPLTFRVAPGSNIRPFIELGAWYDYAFSDNEADDYLLVSDLGILVQGGIMFFFGKIVRFEVGYNYHFGITPSLHQEVLLPLDQSVTEKYKQQYRGFSFRLMFRLY